MSSKKILVGRSAALPRRNDFTKQFKKDWKRCFETEADHRLGYSA